MTEHTTRVDELGLGGSDAGANRRYQGACTCGWRGKQTVSKGAAAGGAAVHAKTGQPAKTGPSKAMVDAAVAQLQAELESPAFAQAMAEVDAMLGTGYTLPATLVRVTSDEYRLADLRSLRMRGADWDPFTAKLQRREGSGWKTVATVEDEGHGGQWDIVFLDGKQLPGYAPGVVRNARLFEVFNKIPMTDLATGQKVTGYERYIDVPSPESKRFVDWCLRMPGKDCDYDGEPEDWTPHAVVAVLVQEAQVAKELNGKRTRTCILDEGMDPSKQYAMLSGAKDPADVARYLIRNRKPKARIWTSGAWRTIEEVIGK